MEHETSQPLMWVPIRQWVVPLGYCKPGETDIRLRPGLPVMLFALRFTKDVEVSRRERVRELFVVQCPTKRTANDVLHFFLWLRQCGPDLLPRSKQGDVYQQLKVDLDGLFLSDRPPG